MWKKRKQIAFLIASNFVIHAQTLIFTVFKIASRYTVLFANKIFRGTALLLIYFYHQFVPALNQTSRQLMI